MPWVQRTVHEAAYGGDVGAALQLWLWLQREGWGLIPGAPCIAEAGRDPCCRVCGQRYCCRNSTACTPGRALAADSLLWLAWLLGLDNLYTST